MAPPPPAQTWESPWDDADSRPLVVVSLSTTVMEQRPLAGRVLQAGGDLPIRVLFTLGPALRVDGLAIPDNVATAQFVPHGVVMPRAAAAITHAGLGTVGAALGAGVPLVCVPSGRDQGDNAVRVVEAGAGVRVSSRARTRTIRGRFRTCRLSRGALVFQETQQRRRLREDMAEKTLERHVRIAGRPFHLRNRDIVRAMRSLEPEPIASHFVVIASRRFPPKQVISAVTGLDRADFTTHQARRTLMRLGFAAGRRASGVTAELRRSRTGPSPDDASRAGRLLELAGQWVAIRDGDVLHASATAQQLVRWLTEHGQKADSVYRVPDSELAATGLAPL